MPNFIRDLEAAAQSHEIHQDNTVQQVCQPANYTPSGVDTSPAVPTPSGINTEVEISSTHVPPVSLVNSTQISWRVNTTHSNTNTPSWDVTVNTSAGVSEWNLTQLCYNLTIGSTTTTQRPHPHTDQKVAFMFASKAVMQLIANPFIGPITNR